ncbi:MAG: amidohydrolase family protein [Acidimicrobiales bacterium]
MQIDIHSHILALSANPAFTAAYGREGSLCICRSQGQLPSHRMPTESEWVASGYAEDAWPTIGVEQSLADHEGFDKIVVLAVSPQYLEGELIGTVDNAGLTDVPGPPHPDKCNDYIADIVRQSPDRMVGFASVNPFYHGVERAVEELERSVVELGLAGLKLYPMYQHWSPSDPDVAFPIFAKAQDLGIPVMVHQAGSTRIDARMELGRPSLLDDVGREFRNLTVILAHCGIPWLDEAMFLLTKHPNFYADLSYHIATVSRSNLFLWLSSLEDYFVPLEKIFFGSDYPGFLYDPSALREKLLSVNDEAERLSMPQLDSGKLRGIMGDHAQAALWVQEH